MQILAVPLQTLRMRRMRITVTVDFREADVPVEKPMSVAESILVVRSSSSSSSTLSSSTSVEGGDMVQPLPSTLLATVGSPSPTVKGLVDTLLPQSTPKPPTHAETEQQHVDSISEMLMLVEAATKLDRSDSLEALDRLERELMRRQGQFVKFREEAGRRAVSSVG